MNGNFLITGAAGGFGAEFSRRVLEGGGKVILADKNVTAGEVITSRGKIVIPFKIFSPGDNQRVKGKVWRAEMSLL